MVGLNHVNLSFAGFCTGKDDGEYAVAPCAQRYASCTAGRVVFMKCANEQVFDEAFGGSL